MKDKRIRFCAFLFAIIMLGAMLANTAANKTATEKTEVKDAPLRFYLVRHGQTYSNIKEATIGGGGNAQLTAKGRNDAFSLGLGLADDKIEFIAAYSSTLARAHETAQWILLGMDSDLGISEKDGLKDISWGEVEGGRIADLEGKYGKDGNDFLYYFGNYFDEDFKSPVKGTESTREFSDRFEKELSSIAEAHKGESGNILVTGHSTIGFYLSKFADGKPSGTPNTSACIVDYKDGEFSLVEYGNVEYLQYGQKKIEDSKPLEVIIVTSPQTIFQNAGVLEGTSDSLLNENGLKSAETLSSKLGAIPINGAYSSDLNRSKKTNSIALDSKNVTVKEDGRLNEMFLGYWEAEKIRTLEEKENKNYSYLVSGNHINLVPAIDGGGEKAVIASYRLSSFLHEVAPKYQATEGRILVFTHPFILKAYLNETFPTFRVPNTKNMQMVTLSYKNNAFEMSDYEEISGK